MDAIPTSKANVCVSLQPNTLTAVFSVYMNYQVLYCDGGTYKLILLLLTLLHLNVS